MSELSWLGVKDVMGKWEIGDEKLEIKKRKTTNNVQYLPT